MQDNFFGSLGSSFSAASAAELEAVLEGIDITVPRRTRGRRSEHRERYCIVHYLRTLERNGLVQFPLRITKRESPDFEIEIGSRFLGLEVTDAGHPRHQQAMTELEKAPPGSLLEENVVRKPGEALRGRGFAGDEPERFWTQEVLAAVREKTARLAAYEELPAYELLLYDNTEYPTWEVPELLIRLAGAIREWREAEPPAKRQFSSISVLKDRVLMFDVTDRSYILPIPPGPSLPPLLPLVRLGVSEEDLHAFCRQHRIRKLGFFGSVRGERFGPHSDVDVLVEFEPSYRIGLIGLAGVELELSRLLNRKADLRTVPDLSRYFREEVVREKSDLAYAYAAG